MKLRNVVLLAMLFPLAALGQIVNPGGGGGSGTVTHTTGALTAGFLTIGNGGADIGPSTTDFGVTLANATTFRGEVAISGNTTSDTAGVNLIISSSSTNQTGIELHNLSSSQAFFNAVAGSGGTTIPGYFIYDAVNNNVGALFHATSASAGFQTMQTGNTLNWASGADIFNNAADTGISRDSAGIVDIGNGTAGNISGGIKLATVAASGANTGSNIKAGESDLGFSATPTFSTSVQLNVEVLSGNVTTFTLPAGAAGQNICLSWAHDATATAYTVTPPANVRGFFTVGTTASKISTQCYAFSSNASAWLATSTGSINQ